ncbi:glycosyltransferase family A protein [Flavobacterium sp.]|uniref:glycosyltransferase family 2 protein n=1 Tax=Flavobacterium sp. TaxID=239 RepID=UPI002B4AAFEF|nr:glycosyltransferase family A protein [Flavobacterium sp.]HLF51240.1 glycosyltransferase family A protein [Flavobacterium sp.]
MIVVYHSDNKITEVVSVNHQKIKFDAGDAIALGLQKLAIQFPDQKLVWCHDAYKESLNLTGIDTVFYHPKMMLSYSPRDIIYFDTTIGYVEDSLFLKVKKEVRYPTWQMSSIAGVVHATLVLETKDKLKPDDNFDYYLNAVAKRCMPLGLLCYSEPALLKPTENCYSPKASTYKLFRFVKQHYKTKWVFLLFLNVMLYERKYPIFPMMYSLFFKKQDDRNLNLDRIKNESAISLVAKATVDVIIPTIGREKYLYDFLLDLKSQTHLPANIIIIEQNPLQESKSTLDYLTSESWPFKINHIFTHQSGVCNARNMALAHVTEEWIFFADDDIRIDADFIQRAIENIRKVGAKAVSVNCFQKGEQQKYNTIFQWVGFGSGCSFVFSESLKNCKFGLGYEFGFGEDGDFGMQLRNQGCDVLYLPDPKILHLKAPIGGFRTKPVLQWQMDLIQPKPSPTVMLFLISHRTKEQILGYKTTLFFKYYRLQKIKNPIRYLLNFNKQWQQSMFWANELKKVG